MSPRSLVFMSILLLVASLVAFVPLPLPQATPAERTFRIAASSYEFSPAQITVNPGDRVTIELTSLDVVHGLYLDAYDLHVTADPGQTETLTFTADRSGTYRFRCSVTCGDLHPFMIGKLRVGPNILLWRGVAVAVLTVIALLTIRPFKFQIHPEDLEG